MSKKLITLCTSSLAIITFADNAGAVTTPLPPQAILSVEPQERPPAHPNSTRILWIKKSPTPLTEL